MIITSLFWKQAKFKGRHQRNFWSFKNVQKYYNYKSVLINGQEILCHAALEVLREHYLKKGAKMHLQKVSTYANLRRPT